jgi:4-diphosphocytidyl-2-C-methyl-D-erythritol kinase
MVALDWHDTLRFEDEGRGELTLRCDDPSLPTDHGNLVIRAAELLRQSTGCTRGAAITLAKAIPAQAGLAGGSSDAAATLLALDRLWNLQTPPERLDELAGQLGSDIAFFLHGPAAICRGRGERVEPIDLPYTFECVVIVPSWGLSTPEVYRHVQVPEDPRSVARAREAFASGDRAALGQAMFNRLEPAARRVRPEIGTILDHLQRLSPYLDGHLLSGSGSACFGLARDLTAAQSAARHLDALGLGTVRVATCGRRDLSSTA